MNKVLQVGFEFLILNLMLMASMSSFFQVGMSFIFKCTRKFGFILKASIMGESANCKNEGATNKSERRLTPNILTYFTKVVTIQIYFS